MMLQVHRHTPINCRTVASQAGPCTGPFTQADVQAQERGFLSLGKGGGGGEALTKGFPRMTS